MSTHHTNRLLVRAIDPAHLDVVRTTGADGHGNQLRPLAGTGHGEPLRCCLRSAEAGEQITLIFLRAVRTSVGVEGGRARLHSRRAMRGLHAHRPAARTGGHRSPRLRTYRADDTMSYDHNTVVTDEADLQPIIERLLSKPDVTAVHVRTLAPQCFLYAVAAD